MYKLYSGSLASELIHVCKVITLISVEQKGFFSVSEHTLVIDKVILEAKKKKEIF